MRQLIVTTFLLLVTISSAHGFQYWNDIRNSASLPGATVHIRVENPVGAGIENYVIYSSGGVQEQVMTQITDGPSTLGATIPGPASGIGYYGFRLIQGGELDLMPVRLTTGADPSPDELTRVAEDAAGDELFGYVNLDLTDCFISFSDDRLYAAVENAGGGFPVSSGLTFFSYMLGIANPALADPDTVWGLLYTIDQAGIISPGLYRIEGPGLGDMTKLGEITVTEYPAANTLVISCLLSDLMADPNFTAWYDTADPTIGIAGFTQRITLLGGAAEADRSPGGRCYLREYAIGSGPNQLPVLTNADIPGTFARIDYTDPDGNCPVVSEIVFDGSLTYPLYPLTLDYGGTVTYRSEDSIGPLADSLWTTAVFRFSDNQTDVVEYVLTATGVADNQGRVPRGPEISSAPNPFGASTTIRVFVPEASHVTVSVFDVRGRIVTTLADEYTDAGYREFNWRPSDGTNHGVRSGVYFARVTSGGWTRTSKVVELR
jgi:hypothetical protein